MPIDLLLFEKNNALDLHFLGKFDRYHLPSRRATTIPDNMMIPPITCHMLSSSPKIKTASSATDIGSINRPSDKKLTDILASDYAINPWPTA